MNNFLSEQSPPSKMIKEGNLHMGKLLLGEEGLNVAIDNLWKQVVIKHPIERHTKEILDKTVSQISNNTVKDADIYWDKICAEIKDPFQRMIALTMLQKDSLGLTPKQVLQNYLDRVRFKQSAQQNHTKFSEAMSQLMGPATIATLVKDPVSDVCDPIVYARNAPNCIQVSTVFSRIFSILGEPSVPMRYSTSLFPPHVGILLFNSKHLLKYDSIKTDNGGEKDIVKEIRIPAVTKWRKNIGK